MNTNRKIILIIAAALATALSGCITEEKCMERYPPKEIHTVTNNKEIIRKDSLIPGATVRTIITKDSIAWFPAYRVIKDTSGRAELRFYRDAYGNLVMECNAKDLTVKKIRELISEKSSESKTQIIKEDHIPWWIKACIILLLCIIVFDKVKGFLPKLNPMRFFKRG